MASKTQQTEKIRARKARPNKANVKADEKRLRKNVQILRQVCESTG